LNKGGICDYFGVEKTPLLGIDTLMLLTTAGTGVEVTPNAILTDTRKKLKKGIVSHYLFSTVAIIDPLLTVSLPPQDSTGMDTLTHAIESYLSVNSTDIMDMFAEKAIRLICGNIREAFTKGKNMKARYHGIYNSAF